MSICLVCKNDHSDEQEKVGGWVRLCSEGFIGHGKRKHDSTGSRAKMP